MCLILSPRLSFCIFLPGMGQIGKGGTRVRLGVGVLEHQRWTGFSRRSLLGYLHNYRSGVFQNREDWCIWLGHFTLQFVWHSGPGLWCGRGERGIIPHRSFEQRPVHVWLDNSTTTRGMRSAMGSKCSYDRGLFDGSIGGFLFEKSSEFVVERFWNQELIEKKRIEVLFRSQIHFMIQNIEKIALLSEYVNLLITEMEPETADQEMRDFEM
ncbi:hypothetical protein BDDG_13919 [Blastomyces dermatitidis ATCC 18188]|uniref:Uncharacterized protein n=1 Tax=Ajellomyces dermatitidis (strain ATCC 18188 / CBS 674.68) TaxID=653446 RepID=A0A0J9HKM1_AJEDA|nr:hypothetical protein BDDG_13919 [Blastomyces dermatitidis ATCC 18188]